MISFSKSLHKITRVFQATHELGILMVLSFISLKLRNKFMPDNLPTLTKESWLSFYQNRKEISHSFTKKINTDKYPKISIIVLTYNNLIINKICLHSIYCNTTYPNFEVIVVDNASSDDTPTWLKTFSKTHPNVKLILNSTNLGFGPANNQAVHEASGEFIVLLNNDTSVSKGWLKKLLAHIQNDSNIGIVGPVTNATGNEAMIPVNYNSPLEKEFFAANRAYKFSRQAFDIRMLAFYCVIMRKKQYESFGGLDERYGLGMFEDEDMAETFKQHDMRVVCADDVFIHHFQRLSFSKIETEKYDRIFEQNRKKFEEKWGHEWQPYKLRDSR